jgi:tRNA (cmo5U34)-methyltransferase
MENKHSELVKEHFDKEYKEYDALIRKLIPRYEEMHQMVVDSLNFPKDSQIQVLDLGIGTGQTALRILEKFPNARVDGVDLSQNMISQAKIRLKNHLNRVKFYNEDIIKSNFTKKYDAVVSVLCIHHLNSEQKQQFFQKIIKSIRENGFFVIADIVKFDTEVETRAKEKQWHDFLIKQMGDKEGNFWFNNYKEEDLPDSTNNQIKWLENSGFRETKCSFEYMNYAVIVAKK